MHIIRLRKRYWEVLLGVCLSSVCERCFISQVPFTSVDMDQISVSSSLKFGKDRMNYRATVAHPFNYTLKQLEVHSLSERRGRKYNQQVRSRERAAKYKAVILYLPSACLSSQRIAEPDYQPEKCKEHQVLLSPCVQTTSIVSFSKHNCC